MNHCQKRYCGCNKYKQKEHFSLAKRQYPTIESPIEKWECNEEFQKTCKDFQAPPPRMTDEEYLAEHTKLINELPEEFRSYASGEAWAHSAGYEEVIMILRWIVEDLKGPIEKYKKRVIDSNH